MRKAKRKLDILAPVGDIDMLRAAVFSGADCVYVGVQGFNARGGAQGFKRETLKQAAAFCRARDCEIYAALNIIVLPGEEENCKAAILDIAAAGCNGIIVQDLGAAQMVKQLVPDMPVFASTQMSVHSAGGVQTLQKLGFAQAILARELSKSELVEIAQTTTLPLEVFVHGALCVSVSGQCYFSAFLGGRSANRGSCAGTCRLPFKAVFEDNTRGCRVEENHLSLKDLSVLQELPALQEMGISTVKIEGRLRGAEYTAAVVQAAKLALAGKEYNKQFVQDIYSRSGFTDGWYTGKKGKDMFGVRTEKDSAAARSAAPKARDIFRRELARVPVSFSLELAEKEISLTITDGENTLQKTAGTSLDKVNTDSAPLLERALGKTGGTPFYLEKADINTNGFYAHVSEVNTLKTALLEELLQKRMEDKPCKTSQNILSDVAMAEIYAKVSTQPKAKRIVARFESIVNLPQNPQNLCDVLILPLADYDKIPAEIRHKTYLQIPRINFQKQEQKMAELAKKTKHLGFAGFEAGNLAHFSVFEGEKFFGGFGLNITNKFAADSAVQLGCESVTLSQELTLAQAWKITMAMPQSARTALLAYGYMPLMVTRACPLQNITDCAGCPKHGFLYDRKGKNFAVHCADGVRTIYNTVPLYMADKNISAAADDTLLYFTHETQQQVQDIIQKFKHGKPFDGEITRGLYEKGVTV